MDRCELVGVHRSLDLLEKGADVWCRVSAGPDSQEKHQRDRLVQIQRAPAQALVVLPRFIKLVVQSHQLSRLLLLWNYGCYRHNLLLRLLHELALME